MSVEQLKSDFPAEMAQLNDQEAKFLHTYLHATDEMKVRVVLMLNICADGSEHEKKQTIFDLFDQKKRGEISEDECFSQINSILSEVQSAA